MAKVKSELKVVDVEGEPVEGGPVGEVLEPPESKPAPRAPEREEDLRAEVFGATRSEGAPGEPSLEEGGEPEPEIRVAELRERVVSQLPFTWRANVTTVLDKLAPDEVAIVVALYYHAWHRGRAEGDEAGFNRARATAERRSDQKRRQGYRRSR